MRTACAIFCSLKFHVVCTRTFFGDTCASWEIGKWSRYSDSDWLIDWFTYHTDIWLLTLLLVFNIWVSHALEMTINFYYPTLELFCFSFTQPFTHSKFCLPNPFLFGATPPPSKKNDQSLTKRLDWLKHDWKLTSYCHHSLQTPTTLDCKQQHHGLSVLEVPCKVRLKTSCSFYTGCIKKR
jgi:hypothetical protein